MNDDDDNYILLMQHINPIRDNKSINNATATDDETDDETDNGTTNDDATSRAPSASSLEKNYRRTKTAKIKLM